MIARTRERHWLVRRQELDRLTTGELCALYRRLGGLGGSVPPEKWEKDEVANSIVGIEWDRLPDGQKLPDPPRLCPPCDECGKGEQAACHGLDGHHYRYTHDPHAEWVPVSEAEAARLAELGLA